MAHYGSVRSGRNVDWCPDSIRCILHRILQRPAAHPVRSRNNTGCSRNSRLSGFVLIPKRSFLRNVAFIEPVLQLLQTLLHAGVHGAVFQLAVSPYIPLLRKGSVSSEDPGRVTHPGVQACLEANAKRNYLVRSQTVRILVLEGIHYFLQLIDGCWCFHVQLIQPILADP
ncbi:hypothetical protein D3C75_1045840 [compost metagenome]